jgi:hypothetical protein
MRNGITVARKTPPKRRRRGRASRDVLREQHHGEERDRHEGELLERERGAEARGRPDEPTAR